MAAIGDNDITTESFEAGSGQLTNRQFVQLGRAISSPDMESIALGYLQFDEEIIKSLHYEHRGNAEAFNRDILRREMGVPEPWIGSSGGEIKNFQKYSRCGFKREGAFGTWNPPPPSNKKDHFSALRKISFIFLPCLTQFCIGYFFYNSG